MGASDRQRGLETRSAGAPRRRARIERLAYALFAAACTLWVAHVFYSSLRTQTLFAVIDPHGFADQIKQPGPWSAPLDDVFIHFDFARSTARGYPFQWSEGNGYSSGGTSLAYPFVLAFGYWIGFRQLSLMVWAGVVACVSVFGLLLALRRCFRDLPVWTSYLAPPALLCVGALDWSLFSGMEVAFFLGVWGGALVAWDELVRPTETGAASVTTRALLLGAWCAAIVATRPEAAVVVAVLAIGAAGALWRRDRRRDATWALVLAAAPGALIVIAQAIANRVLTGDSTAAGALVKLELYHPYMSAAQVWDSWKFFLGYQILRVTQYHFADQPAYGWLVWALAAFALVPARTRRYAALLWASAATWVMIVSLNGQVRWQNERYTMPAVAWLLIAAALGTAALLAGAWRLAERNRKAHAAGAVIAIAAVALFVVHQRPRFRDQVWFFGRASRNILEQHIHTGWELRYRLHPTPHRILLSDAGAIPYASDLPSLDLIGLGGYHDVPFARATPQGLGATLELIERMKPAERPDVIATYPSWWPLLVMWFGDRLGEVPVRGNVICGGAAQVIYRADWRAFEHSAEPLTLEPGARVVDELDVADIVDEKQHRYALSRRDVGFVDMKILDDPAHPGSPLWDAGRVATPDVAQDFELHGFTPGRPVRVLLRLAPPQAGSIAVDVDGKRAGIADFSAGDVWVEPAVEVPADRVRASLHVRLTPLKGEVIVYHVFAVQRR